MYSCLFPKNNTDKAYYANKNYLSASQGML